MLDIQFVRDNQVAFKKAIKDKDCPVDLDRLLELDQERRRLISAIDQARAKRKQLSKEAQGSLEPVKRLKTTIAKLEKQLKEVLAEFFELLYLVPNLPSEDTPIGQSDDDNQILKTVGQIPKFNFRPKPHWEMPQFIDEARAVRISGQRFAFLKGDFVWLQMAAWRFCYDVLTSQEILGQIIEANQLKVSDKPFLPILPPTMMRTESYLKTGRLQKGGDTFKLADDDLWLTGSAEHTLCAYYQSETLAEADLPVRLLGSNTAYRREVGSAGKDTRGIIRQHQFDKLEMESFSSLESGFQEHKFMIAIQEYLMTELEQPFQTVLKCTGDMGRPNIRGVDIETWMAGQGVYRETHSADYLGDYQSRGLATFYQPTTGGQKELVCTNDATAFCQRPLAAILENNQLADGRVKIPAVLRPYLNNREYLK